MVMERSILKILLCEHIQSEVVWELSDSGVLEAEVPVDWIICKIHKQQVDLSSDIWETRNDHLKDLHHDGEVKILK